VSQKNTLLNNNIGKFEPTYKILSSEDSRLSVLCTVKRLPFNVKCVATLPSENWRFKKC